MAGKAPSSNSVYLETSLRKLPSFQSGQKFLKRYGGEHGLHMIAAAAQEMRALRKGTRGRGVSFDACLKRQADKLLLSAAVRP